MKRRYGFQDEMEGWRVEGIGEDRGAKKMGMM